MPFVTGFLRVRRRRPGGGPVDPDYGIDEGPEVSPPDEGNGDAHPDHPIALPPPGIWPPLTPEHPWRPLPSPPMRPGQGLPGGPTRPGQGLPPQPGQPLPDEPPTVGGGPVLPPGMIWPPLPEGIEGKYLALVLIAGAQGLKYHYTVIDAGLRPDQGLPGRPRPPRPDQGLPPEHGHPDQGLPPTAEPRRTG